jgi:heme exporter protein D
MFDLESDQVRKTYQLCRLGFAINAIALILACFTSLLDLFHTFEPGLLFWNQEAILSQWLNAPMVWCCLIGTTLLWGRWDNPSWQRRSGLLLAMFLVDVSLWFISSGETLGLHFGDFGHGYLRSNLGIALGWSEFALLSSLSSDYLVHLGIEHANESDKSIRSMAATGAMVWMLLFCQQTDWGAGWPLRPRPPQRFGMEAMLLGHGFLLIWAITVIQVTALVVSAVRQTSRVLEEMDREDQGQDLLRSRSDSSTEFSSVRSRDKLDDLA